MFDEHDRVYDSFVIRIWHDGTVGDLRRVEVEHVQTGEIVNAAAVSPEWILERLRASLLASHPPTPLEPRAE